MRNIFKINLPLLLSFLAMPVILSAQFQVFQSDKLTKAWETEKVFDVPESICYDATGQVLFVSNVVGKPSEKDGEGFISKVSLEGKVIVLEWVTGLNAPKGMGTLDGYLFVTDIDQLVKIEIKSGKIVKRYPAEGAKFLNDIAVNASGEVYISDTGSGKIFRLKYETLDVWLEDPQIVNPNGLLTEKDMLYIGCRKLLSVDYSTKTIEVISLTTGAIDGLKMTDDGGFIFSDWNGNVYLLNREKELEPLLDTTAERMNAADIEYLPEKRLLIVPTFYDNRIIAYNLDPGVH